MITLRKIFLFSLSTVRKNFSFSRLILEQMPLHVLLGFTIMITIDKKNFQDYSSRVIFFLNVYGAVFTC